MNLVQKLILVIVLIGFSACNGAPPEEVPIDPAPPADPAPPPAAPVAKVTVHVYTNNEGGSVVWCPEELDPPPTTWTYNGTAEVDEDSEDILSQCELE